MKYPYQYIIIYTIVNWQVSSFKLDPWNMAKSRLVIFASNIIIKSNILLEGREITGHSQCSNLKWYLPLNFLKKKLWKLYTWFSFKLCSNLLLLLSQVLFNEDLSSNQVRYFTTIRTAREKNGKKHQNQIHTLLWETIFLNVVSIVKSK